MTRRRRVALVFLAVGVATPPSLLLYVQMDSQGWWPGIAEVGAVWTWLGLVGLVALGEKVDT